MSFLEKGQDTKELILFIKKGEKYDYRAIANDIASRYPELGNISFLNEKFPTPGLPLFCFTDNEDMVLSADNNTISIAFRKPCYDKIATMVFDVADAFNEGGVELVRLGYISNMFLPVAKIEDIKKYFLVENRVEGMIDFNLGWYRQMKTKFGTINCWEKFITEKTDVDHLIAQYDFNTLVDYKFDFEMKSIKEFLSVADDYIESRIKEI